MCYSTCEDALGINLVLCSVNVHGVVAADLRLITMSQSFSANKEEIPDNEQEKDREKEMTERVSEDADMVSDILCFIFIMCQR